VLVFTQVFAPIERLIFNISSSVLLGLDRAGVMSAQLTGFDTDTEKTSAYQARVIGKRSDVFQDIFIINRGAQVETKVVVGDTLVGFIIEQGDKTSKVRAISSPMYTTGGTLSRSGIPIELTGKGAGLLETRVPRSSDVVRGDMVYHDTGDALVLGRVVDIIDIPSDPFITLRVMHAINITTISRVELLSKDP
jgi:hypothetical protein